MKSSQYKPCKDKEVSVTHIISGQVIKEKEKSCAKFWAFMSSDKAINN